MRRKEEGFLKLTILIYPSEDSPGRYVAHCLELDVLAVEGDPDAAISLLKELIDDLCAAAAADGTLDRILKPAPAEFWHRLAHARRYDPGKAVVRRHIKKCPNLSGVQYALVDPR